MVTRFGSREICDVTFKATVNNQRVGNKEFKAGQPVFVIDTATASNMEQATTTVYAQGGKGYNRLIAWEGEKTMTFTVTDALMSPLGLAVLTGAGFKAEDAVKHIHVTYDVSLNENGVGTITAAQLQEELGLASSAVIDVCNDTKLVPYATILDQNGAIKGWADKVTLSGTPSEVLENIIVVKEGQDLGLTVEVADAPLANATVKLDFYVRMTTGATEITIKPQDFGGFFYVEADTLYRNQDGKDMAATLTFPRVKIQSGFTLSMAPTGDPSTFDFVMDAFPAYTYFDRANKVVVDITIVSGDTTQDTGVEHSHPVEHNALTFTTGVDVVPSTAAALTTDMKENQAKTVVSSAVIGQDEDILVSIEDGIASLNDVEPVAGWGTAKWVALDYNTGEDTIKGISYTNRGTTVVLGDDDIADAEALGLAAGHMVVWVKADLASSEPAKFTITKDKKTTNVTINAVDA